MTFKSRRLATFLFGLATVAISLTLETFVARSYYDVATERLRYLGERAVRSGAEYLPANPRLAEQVADRVANQSGVRREEITLTKTAQDGLGLTIQLEQKVPWRIAIFAFGLPKSIGIEATARIAPPNSLAI